MFVHACRTLGRSLDWRSVAEWSRLEQVLGWWGCIKLVCDASCFHLLFVLAPRELGCEHATYAFILNNALDTYLAPIAILLADLTAMWLAGMENWFHSEKCDNGSIWELHSCTAWLSKFSDLLGLQFKKMCGSICSHLWCKKWSIDICISWLRIFHTWIEELINGDKLLSDIAWSSYYLINPSW